MISIYSINKSCPIWGWLLNSCLKSFSLLEEEWPCMKHSCSHYRVSCQVYKQPPHSPTCAQGIRCYEPPPPQPARLWKWKRSLGTNVANKQPAATFTQLKLKHVAAVLAEWKITTLWPDDNRRCTAGLGGAALQRDAFKELHETRSHIEPGWDLPDKMQVKQ